MPLYVVATPIGNPEDISLRAQKILDLADLIIGEEAKPTRRLLKSVGVSPQKPIELLNEHSGDSDIKSLLEKCKSKNVALVSDCGTPGFCDPGADLVKACREANVPVTSCPGPSSIATFLSLSGHRFNEFYFVGFLPANTELRQKRLVELKKLKTSLIVMDTPYRLKKTLENCKEHFPNRELILGTNLTKENEAFYTGSAQAILSQLKEEKSEFVLAIR